MQTSSIRVKVATRDALAAVAAERGESMDDAIARLIAEHQAYGDVDRIEAWYERLPAHERAAVAALEAGDREGWLDA